MIVSLWSRLEGAFLRRTALLTHPRAPLAAAFCMPLLFGLLSLLLGQDDNWDLKNYHLYNAWAFFNDRIGYDFAPAQFQSYFNPTLDLPYFLMTEHFPARVAGFVMGALHGLNFLLLHAIARLFFNGADVARDRRRALLLALAGCLGAGFLSELGNTMGDNMTALLVLSALLLSLRRIETLSLAPMPVIWAGVAMGAAVGLKPTSATYAVGLCLALLLIDGGVAQRLRAAFVFGLGVLGGMAVTGGWWWLKLWNTFGNPLFPQFNHVFRSPLALQASGFDPNYLPKGLGEALLWPFLFTANFLRVGEVELKQLIWPMLYVLVLVFFAAALASKLAGRRHGRFLGRRERVLLAFFVIAYALWLKLFGIYRYLIPLELLAPLLFWLLAERLFNPAHAARIAGAALVLAVVAVFPFRTWGHAAWDAQAFRAEVPPFAKPADSIVFTAHGNPPMGWLAKFFPREIVFASLGSGFPESPAYMARMQAVIDQRPGPHYVMLVAAVNPKEVSLGKKQAAFRSLGMTGSAAACARLDWLLKRVRFQAQVAQGPGEGGDACALELPPEYRQEVAPLDRETVEAARQKLAGYGLQVDAESCRRHPAWVGADPNPYQICAVQRLAGMPR